MSQVEIIKFDPRYAQTFIDLNKQWIQTYFVIEPMDVAQLEDYQTHILAPGGEILFVLENENPVGTCAMVPHGPGCFELAKMAVDPSTRGKGFGDLLMKAAIDWARKQRAEKIILLSNTILEPAITLYKKHGFVTTHLGPHPDYQRSNIEMELKLESH